MIKLYYTECQKSSEHETGVKLAYAALNDAFGMTSELIYDSRGKPAFSADGVHVSISHSKGICLAAIADSEIGVDIEHMATAKPLTRLADRYFTVSESEYVKSDPNVRFYEIWCAKESYMKYTGEGFSRPMSSFSVFDLQLIFSYFTVGDHMICVCSNEKADVSPFRITV